MRHVLFNPEAGVYLGSCVGLGFWSQWDAAGQTCAVTFATVEEALAAPAVRTGYVVTWEEPIVVTVIQVDTDDEYATRYWRRRARI